MLIGCFHPVVCVNSHPTHHRYTRVCSKPKSIFVLPVSGDFGAIADIVITFCVSLPTPELHHHMADDTPPTRTTTPQMQVPHPQNTAVTVKGVNLTMMQKPRMPRGRPHMEEERREKEVTGWLVWCMIGECSEVGTNDRYHS